MWQDLCLARKLKSGVQLSNETKVLCVTHERAATPQPHSTEPDCGSTPPPPPPPPPPLAPPPPPRISSVAAQHRSSYPSTHFCTDCNEIINICSELISILCIILCYQVIRDACGARHNKIRYSGRQLYCVLYRLITQLRSKLRSKLSILLTILSLLVQLMTSFHDVTRLSHRDVKL